MVPRSYLAVVDQVVVSSGNFAVTFALARYLSKDEFGAFVIAQSILLLSMQVHNALISSPIAVLLSPLNDIEASRFVRSLNPGQLLVCLLLVLLSASVAFVMLLFPGAQDYALLSAAVAGIMFFNLSQSYFRHLLFARFRLADALANDLVCYGWLVCWASISVGSGLGEHRLRCAVGCSPAYNTVSGCWAPILPPGCGLTCICMLPPISSA